MGKEEVIWCGLPDTVSGLLYFDEFEQSLVSRRQLDSLGSLVSTFLSQEIDMFLNEHFDVSDLEFP
jgi:hypothetical protein